MQAFSCKKMKGDKQTDKRFYAPDYNLPIPNTDSPAWEFGEGYYTQNLVPTYITLKHPWFHHISVILRHKMLRRSATIFKHKIALQLSINFKHRWLRRPSITVTMHRHSPHRTMDIHRLYRILLPCFPVKFNLLQVQMALPYFHHNHYAHAPPYRIIDIRTLRRSSLLSFPMIFSLHISTMSVIHQLVSLSRFHIILKG